jgi:hypothetical protein
MFQHFKYQSDDCIICIISYNKHELEPEFDYLLKIVIYHIDNGTAVEQWVEPATTFNPDLNQIYYAFAAPAFLGSKMYFPFEATPGYDWGEPPYGEHCFLPVLEIDIATNTVTLNDARKDDYDDPSMYGWRMYDEVATVDYATNKIYWQATDGYSGDEYLFCLDTSTDAVTIGDTITTQESYQGADTGYGYNDTTGVGVKNVIELPGMSIVNTIDEDWTASAAKAIDLPEQMIWNLKSDELEGRTLSGGSNRSISVIWDPYVPPGTIPFSQADGQYVWITMLNGTMLVLVRSYKSTIPRVYQCDFYLLKET